MSWRYCAENGLDVCNGNRIAIAVATTGIASCFAAVIASLCAVSEKKSH